MGQRGLTSQVLSMCPFSCLRSSPSSSFVQVVPNIASRVDRASSYVMLICRFSVWWLMRGLVGAWAFFPLLLLLLLLMLLLLFLCCFLLVGDACGWWEKLVSFIRHAQRFNHSTRATLCPIGTCNPSIAGEVDGGSGFASCDDVFVCIW